MRAGRAVCAAPFRRGRARSFGCGCAHAHARAHGWSDVRPPALRAAQETPQADSVLQASGKAVAQVLPLVTFLVAALMLLNLLVVQPLKESQAAAQAQLAQTQAQLAQSLAQTQTQLKEARAETRQQLNDVQAETREYLKAVQAETRQQFTALQAALQEVPRLSGKVEVMQDGLRSLQQR